MTEEFKGKVALVTGGNSGIGRSISELFAREGAKVMIGDIQGGKVAQSIQSQGGTARYLKCDVRSSSEVQKLVASCVEEFGSIDLVVNDAGVEQNRSVLDTTEEEWDKIVDTNLKGVFLVSKYAFPHLIKSGENGAMVNVASQLGLVALPGRSAYCASKAGVILLTKVLALEYAKYGVRVNCVCPGPIQTPMLERTHNLDADPEESSRSILSRVPRGRVGKPQDIAETVLFLSSKRAGYITGEYVLVDGGYILP
jgi:dihydroanticapsin dehydrogenase